jgi:hypothetical protein
MQMESDLCQLVATLSLNRIRAKVRAIRFGSSSQLIRCKESESPSPSQILSNDAQDVTMSNMECQMFPNASAVLFHYSRFALIYIDQYLSSAQEEIFGCPLLQAIQRDINSFSTTAGGYLDTIFGHRAVLARFPKAHVDCARGFGDLAFLLERRAWRADREGDQEAVNAFRYESWLIANTIPSL